MDARRSEELFEKLKTLTQERLAEVEDFVDFLRMKDQDRALAHAAAAASESTFAQAWDNPEDAVYDAL
ncbi:MAG: hypothetical protein BroJett013_06020 [Alphaproteobacteria bacterium]|nr:MAG: hypothetical protein BroJett013_06020 [Alphaproteobacteria bacterium]